jgi:hypothetical protein
MHFEQGLLPGVQSSVQAHGRLQSLDGRLMGAAIPKAQRVRQPLPVQVHQQQQQHQDLSLLNPGAAYVGAPDGVSAPPAYFTAYNSHI